MTTCNCIHCSFLILSLGGVNKTFLNREVNTVWDTNQPLHELDRLAGAKMDVQLWTRKDKEKDSLSKNKANLPTDWNNKSNIRIRKTKCDPFNIQWMGSHFNNICCWMSACQAFVPTRSSEWPGSPSGGLFRYAAAGGLFYFHGDSQKASGMKAWLFGFNQGTPLTHTHTHNSVDSKLYLFTGRLRNC